MPTAPEHTVAARIAERLAAWHAGAQPGEHTPYVLVAVLDQAGREVVRASLTYRQAEELAAWQAGVTSITCTPWALAAELRRWIDLAPAAAAAGRTGTIGWVTAVLPNRAGDDIGQFAGHVLVIHVLVAAGLHRRACSVSATQDTHARTICLGRCSLGSPRRVAPRQPSALGAALLPCRVATPILGDGTRRCVNTGSEQYATVYRRVTHPGQVR